MKMFKVVTEKKVTVQETWWVSGPNHMLTSMTDEDWWGLLFTGPERQGITISGNEEEDIIPQEDEQEIVSVEEIDPTASQTTDRKV